MNSTLLSAMKEVEKAVRADLLAQYYADPALMAQARAVLLAEEASQTNFAAWLVTFAGRAATLYLLETLYVRVLEDQGLLAPARIRDGGTYQLFAELFPHLGEDAYLRTAVADAARLLPELFAATPVAIAQPSAASAKLVWNLWQQPRDGGRPFDFGGAELDTRFIGDLYQDLDPEVKDRYALLQTPEFVEEFILDRTLTPALATFGLAGFRLLDPTCGSGHFLVGAFRRLAAAWRAELGDPRDPAVCWQAALRALASVSGCDLNEYACALSRFRLLLAVVRETGASDATRLRELHFDVITADALIPWERLVEQPLLDGSSRADWVNTYGTAEQRARNAAFFGRPFHAVVGNPPYKSVSDKAKRETYKRAWPRSASGKYTLSAPMMERFLLLPVPGGRAGFINSNNFAKREFGRGVVTKVFRDVRLDLVVDTSGAYLPGHGTPTVMVFATRERPAPAHALRVVAGKRGEPSEPADPARSIVWSAIVTHIDEPGYEDRYVAIGDTEQDILCRHPWSLGSDAVTRIKAILDAYPRVRDLGGEAGPAVIIIEDDAYFRRYSRGLPLRRVVVGEDVRDWTIGDAVRTTLVPYEGEHLVPESRAVADLWPLRATLQNRPTFGGQSYRSAAEPWWKYHQVTKGRRGLGVWRILTGEQATHSHFVVDSSDAISTQTAPVVTLRDATEDVYRDVAAILNSSSLEFWFKQVCHEKGNGGIGGGISAETWEKRFIRNGTNVVEAPLLVDNIVGRSRLVSAIWSLVDTMVSLQPRRILDTTDGEHVELALSNAAQRRTMARESIVALQEELDWLLYRLFGVADTGASVPEHSGYLLASGHRPFEIALSRKVDSGEETTTWFDRHTINRVSNIPARYTGEFRAVLEARLQAIESDEALAILEQPVYKRRWQWTTWEDDVRCAVEDFIADRLEAEVKRFGPEHPPAVDELLNELQRDAKLVAVAALLGQKNTFRLRETLEKLLTENAIPDTPSRLFTPGGLHKYLGALTAGPPDATASFAAGEATDWKRVWRLQEREDTGEDLGALRPAPPFKREDYAHRNGWTLRGKFNVANERFISYDDVTPRRYGWGGWTTSERALASLHAVELRDGQPDAGAETPTVDDPARCSVQFALWDKLDELRRTGDQLHPFVREVAAACQAVCPCPVLDAWRAANEPVRGRKRASRPVAPSIPVDPDEAVAELAPEVLAALLAAVDAGGERGVPAKELVRVTAGDEPLLRRALDTLRARGAIVALGKGRGTRYTTARQESLI